MQKVIINESRHQLRKAIEGSRVTSEALRQVINVRGDDRSPKLVNKIKKNTILKNRCDIVSGKLCDDVLKYMSPVLDQYRNTIIIDFNPGACVWSSKLHDYLKPKRHLLLEPDESYYESSIKPLLDKPGSTYKYSTLKGVHRQEYWETWTKIFQDQDLLPPRPQLQIHGREPRQLDTTLLITGNMFRNTLLGPKRGGKALPSAVVMKHMVDAALTNSLFFSHGLCRLLLWASDDLRDKAYPQLLEHLSTFSQSVNIAFDSTQVAASKQTELAAMKRSAVRPFPHANADAITAQTQALLQRHGIERATGATDAYKWDSNIIADINPLRTTCESLADLQNLIQECRDRLPRIEQTSELQLPKSQVRESQKVHLAVFKAFQAGLRYPQLHELLMQTRLSERIHNSPPRILRVLGVLDVHVQLLNLETECVAFFEKHPEHEAHTATRDAILDLVREVDFLSKQHVDAFTFAIVDTLIPRIHAACMPETPSAGMHDRQTNALLIEEDEVWPPREMNLFMLTPRVDNIAFPGTTGQHGALNLWNVFISTIMAGSKKGMDVSLDRLGYFGYNVLEPLVPALRDPRKGGRLDPKKATPRLITRDVLLEIFKHFCAWPFRFSEVEMFMATEGADVSTGTAATDEEGTMVREEFDDDDMDH